MEMIKRLSKVLPLSYKSQAQLQFYRGVSSKLFVKGMTFRTTENDLAKAFSEFGEVTEAKVIYDKLQKSKGYGYVTFNSVSEADDALVAMNGKLLDGRSIYVDHVKPNPYINQGIPIATGPPTPYGELPAPETKAPSTKTRTRKPKQQPSVPEPPITEKVEQDEKA
ncbi:unnamed protein product [Rhodiola kirilowii]